MAKPVDLAEEEFQRMLAVANQAKEYAYARYSKFRVGAAILCDDGTVVGGCNVEGCTYGTTVCAERCGLLAAIAQGHLVRDREGVIQSGFTAVLVTSDEVNDFCYPCGACRQVIAEFGLHIKVIVAKNGCKSKVEAEQWTIADLLPAAFTMAILARVEKERGDEAKPGTSG